MIAVDTNILLRLLLNDDHRQHQAARALVDTSTIHIPITVVLETEWVLRCSYGFDRAQVRDAFAQVLGLANVNFGERESLEQALAFVEHGLDFADALHLALSQTIGSFATFDQRFAKRAEGLGSCAVKLLGA